MDPSSPWWGEHRSRYHLAATRVMALDVLDIACGSGYGCTILADAGARTVVGMDIDARFAKKTREEVSLCSGDGTRLPLKPASVDVITSFETIEHIEADDTFLDELRRVLRPDGLLFLSTPNAMWSPKKQGGKSANPFHVREYTPDELNAILSRNFSKVMILGQRTKRYYPVSPFWERDEVMGDDIGTRARVISWKVRNRMPFALKDGLSRLLHNRSFFPGEFDFDFDSDHKYSGHVIVAMCRF